MTPTPVLFDVVALTEDLPTHGLSRGQVGTVVEKYEGGAMEVEFSDGSGRTYALLALRPDQVLVLRFAPEAA
ncbi:MAG TPA: DUF4926 domain-containing protein [Bacteroidetes bacterium]|nr:DUF4926 domain-containing protein [Bacteroidota bacterium]HIL56607.1 DUF4926 domain-containing protein [Rhodothermales bacterium]